MNVKSSGSRTNSDIINTLFIMLWNHSEWSFGTTVELFGMTKFDPAFGLNLICNLISNANSHSEIQHSSLIVFSTPKIYPPPPPSLPLLLPLIVAFATHTNQPCIQLINFSSLFFAVKKCKICCFLGLCFLLQKKYLSIHQFIYL